MREGREGNLCTAGALHEDVREGGWILLKIAGDLQDNMILVELGKHGRDLTLSERVVQRVIDILWSDAEPCDGISVNDQLSLQSVELLVTCDINQRGLLTKRFD